MTTPYKLLFATTALAVLSACDRGNIDVDVPTSYRFERDGVSTVSYSGQTDRLAMGAELGTALKDPAATASSLQEMFANQDAQGNDVDPFTSADLNASTKSIRSKVAASYRYFDANTSGSAAIKADFDGWIQAQANQVLPFMDSLATPGRCGASSEFQGRVDRIGFYAHPLIR